VGSNRKHSTCLIPVLSKNGILGNRSPMHFPHFPHPYEMGVGKAEMGTSWDKHKNEFRAIHGRSCRLEVGVEVAISGSVSPRPHRPGSGSSSTAGPTGAIGPHLAYRSPKARRARRILPTHSSQKGYPGHFAFPALRTNDRLPMAHPSARGADRLCQPAMH
jgi:hypothetical protein